jgi:alkyl sulfatase BDS1-like metallo-beta-lactamase superfamily hydrolase
VHDQTIRGINRGLEPDELVGFVKLPPHLASSPYLQEHYGTVEWSVRAIFSGCLGWFSGNSAYLFPLTPSERAQRLAVLAETDAPLLEQTRKAVHDGDYQWAVELADNLMRVEPGLKEARLLKAEALMKLGEQQISANGRHFYLTQALELRGEISAKGQDLSKLPEEFVRSLPISGIVEAMPVNLNAAKSLETNQIVGLRFPDVGEAYTVHVRRGVAEIQPVFPENPEIAVTVDSNVWKEIVMGRRNLAMAFASGDVEVEGSKLKLVYFLRLFERPGDSDRSVAPI